MIPRIILKTFFVFAAILCVAPAPAATYILGPVDDSLVYAAQPNTNYGTISGLATGWTWPGNNDTWLSYLKFDLGAIPSGEAITGASLNLYQFLGAGYASIGTYLYRIGNDNWSEGGITWNNQPSGLTPNGVVLGSLLGGNLNGFAYRGWSSWNLFETNAWNAGADRQDGLLTLQLFETLGGTQTHNFCSKETDPTYCPASAGHQPFLTVTTAAIPLPPALWLLGSGIVGMLALGRRRRNL